MRRAAIARRALIESSRTNSRMVDNIGAVAERLAAAREQIAAAADEIALAFEFSRIWRPNIRSPSTLSWHCSTDWASRRC